MHPNAEKNKSQMKIVLLLNKVARNIGFVAKKMILKILGIKSYIKGQINTHVIVIGH